MAILSSDPSLQASQKKARPLRAVQRVMAILDSFSLERPQLGISEIASLVGLTPSSVYRVVATLERGGFLEQDLATGKYRPGGWNSSPWVRLSWSRWASGGRATPSWKNSLSFRRETINLGVLRHGEVMYVQKIESPEILRAGLTVGSCIPMHCTAIGKVLLAHLPEAQVEEILRHTGLGSFGPNCITDLARLKAHLAEIRERGYSLDDQELQVDARGIAAPIWDHTGKVVAGLSVAGPATRLTFARMEELRPALLRAAEGISRRMGYSPASFGYPTARG